MYQPENTCQMEFVSTNCETLNGLRKNSQLDRQKIQRRMSDDSITKGPQPLKKDDGSLASAPPGGGAANKKSRPLFGRLNQDLQDALSTWDTLSEEMSTKLSPEEEQLREVKRLLSELKSKLNEFED